MVSCYFASFLWFSMVIRFKNWRFFLLPEGGKIVPKHVGCTSLIFMYN